jgi:uncharacterized protein (UPF0332 family)
LNLEDCFKKNLLRKTDPSAAKAKRSLEQARVWVDEAKQTLEAVAYRSGLMAVYMGYFHAARAVLFRDALREKSHVCIELYLEDYVRRGRLEEEWTILYHRLRRARHLDQYSFGAAPNEDEVEYAIDHAEAFIDRIERLLQETEDERKANSR